MIDEIKKAIQKRASVNDEWDYGVEQSWKVVLDIISKDMDKTISFFENDCTGDEFAWLSEIFDEIIDIFPEQKIIDILRKTAKKYPEEVEKYNIEYFINEAEEHLMFIMDTQNKSRF